ncbi:MAG: hypothetical protein ACFCAD_08875 [Pleurocapsa sp.]
MLLVTFNVPLLENPPIDLPRLLAIVLLLTLTVASEPIIIPAEAYEVASFPVMALSSIVVVPDSMNKPTLPPPSLS